MSVASFARIRTKRLREEIADQIKEAIFSNRLKPGDKLPSETRLAAEFGVSRVAIREALKSLEAQGLIAVKRGAEGGAYIPEMDPQHMSGLLANMLRLGRVSVEELTEARVEIEPLVARIAAERATGEELRVLGQIMLETEAAVKRGEPATGKLVEFHRHIARMCRNSVLAFTLDCILNLLEKVVAETKITRSHLKDSIAFHRKIYEAMQQRRPEAAYQVMRRHVIDTHRLRPPAKVDREPGTASSRARVRNRRYPESSRERQV